MYIKAEYNDFKTCIQSNTLQKQHLNIQIDNCHCSLKILTYFELYAYKKYQKNRTGAMCHNLFLLNNTQLAFENWGHWLSKPCRWNSSSLMYNLICTTVQSLRCVFVSYNLSSMANEREV